MPAKPVRQTSGRHDDTIPYPHADPHGDLAAVLDDLEMQVHEDMTLLDDPVVRLLAPSLMVVIRNSTDDLGDAIARMRRTLAAEGKASEASQHGDLSREVGRRM